MRSRAPSFSMVFLVALCASVASAVFVVHSAVWLCGVWLVACGYGAFVPGSNARRLVCVNAIFLLLLFGGAEIYFGLGPEIRAEGSALVGYTQPHDLLGYAPAKGHETTIQRYADGELVYDVTYTIDGQGLRAEPPLAPGAGGECILFFGGSFMFGEGLENDETLPWRVGVETGGRYRVLNFGFHGYGPHQMLAALQGGLVDEIVTCTPRYVVYMGSAFHVPRAAGLSSWEKGGPRYEPTSDGTVVAQGQWDAGRFEYPPWLAAIFASSHVLTKLSTNAPPATRTDYDRYYGILESTRRHVEAAYPTAEMRIVFWDVPDDPIAAELEARGFRVHRVSELLPDRAEDPGRYQLHRHDRHPNARAMAGIAAGLSATFE